MSETQKMIRTLQAIEDIALPQDGRGTMTKSLKGMDDFQADIRVAKIHIAHIKNAIKYREYIDENDVLALEEIAKKSHENES